MLDALESAIAAVRSPNGHPPAPPANSSVTPGALRAGIGRAGIPPAGLVRLLGISHRELNAWLDGRVAIPQWLPATMQLFAMLTPIARRALLNNPRSAGSRVASLSAQPARTHPFTRIEEL